MPGWYQSLYKVAAYATVLLALGSCSGGGSGGGSTTAPPPAAGSATVTGTVSGTVIKVLRADTGAVIATADTASLVNPPFPFTLSSIPVGIPIKVFFFSAGETFPLYDGNPATNVFTVMTAGPIDLGFVTMGGGRATPQNSSSNVTLGKEDLSPLPPGIEPPPATLTVTQPGQASGDVIVDFTVQDFVIGGKGQQHLHIQVDHNNKTRHFFNGCYKAGTCPQSNTVLDDSDQPTTDVVWHSATSFLIHGLAPGQHTVTARLYTAKEIAFANPEAEVVDVPITITSPPAPPSTLTIDSPGAGASLLSGPVDVSFTVQNFTIGGQGAPHLHIYLDGGTTASHFFNAPTNQVLDGNGQPVTNVTRKNNTSFQITGLSNGPHTIRLRLADAADQELSNAEAKPSDLDISIQAPPSPPTLTIISPTDGAQLPPGPVLVTFDIQNSPVPPSTTQPRMHFYVDGDPIVYKFYDGPGIAEDGSLSGVRYLGVHTHFVHWKSRSSISLNALAAGSHQVRFVLVDVDQGETELNTEKVLNFTIQQVTGGDLSLVKVVGGLNVPVAMATSPDGQTIFVNEQITGKVRVVTPTATLPWRLQALPFAANLPGFNSNGREQGLLGIAVHPSFSVNHYVYVYYTAGNPDPTVTCDLNNCKNWVVRLTATTDSNGNTVADGSPPVVILDNIPANFAHNGGFIRFGPSDGMLYIIVGENEVSSSAQDLTSLRGKILRVNPADGSAPGDNPFFSNPNANAQKVYSLGHRNSFGFTFHPHTNDLWESENGPNAHDEINRILAGQNYGWPFISGIGSDPINCPNCINPIFDSLTDRIAPTGIVVIREDSAYPVQYHNNLLFADFNFGQLHRIVLGGQQLTDFVSHSIACDCGQGGLIAVMHGLNMLGQDGYVYVTSATGSIFRVLPP